MTIYCPKCRWQPGPHDLWQCGPDCGTAWNTFDTHGRCPGCGKQWEVTQCPACGAWSPHDDWYHDNGQAGVRHTERQLPVEEKATATAG